MSRAPTTASYAMGSYVIAATGLEAEARIARRSPRTGAVAGGGDGGRLARLIESAISADCRGIISFGMAGGLRGDLRPGACLIGREVLYAGTRWRADATWTGHLAVRISGAEQVSIAGVDQPLVTQQQKVSLAESTGAAAADMESHVAARIAVKYALPFAVLRIVADPSERALPAAVVAGMRADGSTDAPAVLRSLVGDPGQIPALVRVATDAGRAFWALFRCHRRAGPGLGLFDLG